jgi:CHAD domain-containing protein
MDSMQLMSTSPISTAREDEWKLAVPAGVDLVAFVERAVHDGWTVVSSGEHLLRAAYHDTADHRLLGCGHTLRHRTVDGATPGTWTLKLAASTGTTRLRRDEVSTPGRSSRPPHELVDLLTAIARGGELRRVATVTTHRRWTRLVSSGGGCTVEIDDDEVRSLVGRTRGPSWREVEVELVEGDAAAAVGLITGWHSMGATTAPSGSKLASVLADRSVGDRLRPRPIDPSTTLAEAISAVFAAASVGIAGHDPIIRLDLDVEAVHQARVAVRRIRGRLRLLGDVLDPVDAATVEHELDWLGTELGHVRDLDVLCGHLRDRVDADGEGLGDVTDLLAVFHDERAAAHARLLEVLDPSAGSRYRDILDQLHRWAIDPPTRLGTDPATPAAPVLLAAVERAWRRLRHSVEALAGGKGGRAQVGLHDLHDVRKRAKTARYALELATPVLAGRRAIGRWAARFADLQDVLGQLNDSAHAQHRLDQLAAVTASPRVAYAAGRLVQMELDSQRRALRRWPSRWDAVAERRPRLRLR